MGGRGYHNDVRGYLNSNGRTSEYARIDELSTDKVDFIIDTVQPRAPLSPEFSNTAGKTYVLLDKNKTGIKSITIYDENHEQKFSIHLDHNHGENKGPHVHSGMNTGRKDIPLTKEHQKIIDEMNRTFEKWRKKND